MRHPALRLAALLALVATSSAAQVVLPRLTQSIDVRVTNIDVVVTDAAGKRVHGLTRDDFEVYDDAKRQAITNFSEFIIEQRDGEQPPMAKAAGAETAPSASSVPPRHIVIFFDSFSTTREERKRLAPALVKLVRGLRPEDEAMVVRWNRTLRVLVPPTGDHATLEKGIEQAAGELSLSSTRLTMFDDLMGDIPSPLGSPGSSGGRRAERTLAMRRQMREAATDLTESVRGLKGILMRLSGLDGRKALILISTAYSFRPQASIFSDEAADAVWLEAINVPKVFGELAEVANAAGVAIYGLHAQGLDSGWSAAVPGVTVAGDSAIGDFSGLFTGDLPSLQRIRASSGGIDGLSYLAARTGGMAAGSVNYFSKAVAAISEDLGSYYSIGYRSPDGNIDRKRVIEVRTRDKRYTVRARRSTIDRSIETEISDRVMSALLFPSSAPNQLGISAHALSVAKRRKGMKFPLDVEIPMANLTFQSDGGDQLTADLSILIASADTTGSVSTVERFHQMIPISRPQLPTLANKHYTYGMDVDLRTLTAENRVAVAVLDNVSKAMGLVTVDIKP